MYLGCFEQHHLPLHSYLKLELTENAPQPLHSYPYFFIQNIEKMSTLVIFRVSFLSTKSAESTWVFLESNFFYSDHWENVNSGDVGGFILSFLSTISAEIKIGILRVPIVLFKLFGEMGLKSRVALIYGFKILVSRQLLLNICKFFGIENCPNERMKIRESLAAEFLTKKREIFSEI